MGWDELKITLAEIAGGKIVGFVELSIRADVVGLEGKQVGYVEGQYVTRDARWQGSPKYFFMHRAIAPREQECKAFASDRAGRIIIDKSF